jgi:hypothetical protein
MNDGSSLVAAVREASPRIAAGSLSVFGDIFGGRIDNIHFVMGATLNDDGSATVSFNEGEKLTIWDPEEVEVNARRFVIRRASRVRWEWFYYGRPHALENLHYIEHRLADGQVEASSDWPKSQFNPSLESPAVELLGGWVGGSPIVDRRWASPGIRGKASG